MAMRNEVIVYVDGINRTANAVMPFKYGDFLDERLDEARLTLKGLKKQVFGPQTPVEIIIRQTEYLGNWNSPKKKILSKKEYTKQFVVADDAAAEFTPGCGYYIHNMYIIEPTKLAERVVVDTLTVTGDIGRNYTQNVTSYAQPMYE